MTQQTACPIKAELFGVSYDRGFVPHLDPLTSLPKDFSFYDDFGRQLPDFLGAGKVREQTSELPVPLRPVSLLSYEELTLLMIRLSFMASAYVNQNSHFEFTPKRIRDKAPVDTDIVVPRNIAVPLVETAKCLGVPPILSYTFYGLANWKKLFKEGPIVVSNLCPLQVFHGGLDERHFMLEHTEIECNLGPAVHTIPTAQYAAESDNMTYAAYLLSDVITPSIETAVQTMHRMLEACHPDIYYLRVRPFIFGLNLGAHRRVIYEDVDERTPVLRGETGAQTPSFPALWSAMGIDFSNDHLKKHVLNMRNYMLPHHVKYIETIEQGPSLRKYVLHCAGGRGGDAKALKQAYNMAIAALHEFFKLHLYYANIYINRKTKKYALHQEQGAYGTGGTPYMEYLSAHCKEILEHRIR